MKQFLLTLSFLLLTCSAFLFADNESWGGYGGTPTSILDSVVGKANEGYKIQATQLDGISSTKENYAWNPQYRLTNTLAYFKNHIHPYIQRTVYIGLAVATILLIYNGFLMVTNTANGGNGEFSKTKGNLINIGIGVVLLTGFYFLIDLIVALLNFLFD